MKIRINERTANWFKNEVGIKQGEQVRFYTRFDGYDPVLKGYSLGFYKDEPINKIVSLEIKGMTFYIEENDLWFFDEHDLHIEFNEKEDFLEYKYEK